MKKTMIVALAFLIFGVIACSKNTTNNRSNQKAGQTTANLKSDFEGMVLSTQNASRYTYIQYKTPNGKILWGAVVQTDLKKGDKIRLLNPQPMVNFESKSLNKRFDLIYFASGIIVNGKQGSSNPHKGSMGMPQDDVHKGANPHMSQNLSSVDTSKVKKLKGGVTIAEILDNPEKFNGKTVKLRAVVVKFLPDIMKTNWAHLKDASTDKDITVMTKEKFNVGDIVEIEGKVVTDKDFGFGYYYKVLIESAKRIK